jgi:hypothetical protein
MPFVDAFLKHLPTCSECKAVIAQRLSESFAGSVYRSLRTFKDFSAAASAICSS